MAMPHSANCGRAFQYLEHCKKSSQSQCFSDMSPYVWVLLSTRFKMVADSECPWLLQFQCPRENVSCIDNIKVFYHPTCPDRSEMGNFYIGRPGTFASTGLRKRSKSKYVVQLANGGELRRYNFGNGQRTRELLFRPKYPLCLPFASNICRNCRRCIDFGILMSSKFRRQRST